MDPYPKSAFESLQSSNGEERYQAYHYIMLITEHRVSWAYDVWDRLVEMLSDPGNHQRAIAGQLLSNLARSDPEGRMLRDFPALLNGTRDERFVTARHTLQNIWKVGLAGEAQRQMLLDGLKQRYDECITEKQSTIIRYDIIEGLKKLYDQVQDERVKEKALAWIELEGDEKYRKKYAGAWKTRRGPTS